MAMLPLLLVVSLAAPSAFTQTAAPPKVVPPVAQKTAPAKPKEVPVVVTPTRSRSTIVNTPAGHQVREVAPESLVNAEITQLLDEQLTLERRRLELEKAQMQNDAALELRQLELRVQNGEQELDEVRKKAAAGVVTSGVLRTWETNQKITATQLDALRQTLALKLQDLSLREQELLLKHRMQRAGMARPVEESLQAVTPAHRPLGGNQAVLPGDIVTIVIEGRSGGVRDFTVDAAGTIRHPQLGDLIVSGYPTSGVRDKVVKLLVANGLSKDPTVRVIVHRR